MCKADAHVLPLANKLENNTLGNTLLKVEAEVLVVTQVAMLAKIKVQTLARLRPSLALRPFLHTV